MRIFRRNTETLGIKRLRACKAIFQLEREVIEVQIDLETHDKERLQLQINPASLPDLIGELTDIYESINPPLNRRRNQNASWEGSEL